MRTTLDLPDGLVDTAREALGFKSKTDKVAFAFREVVRRGRLDDLKALADEAGSLVWSLDDDFERMGG